MKEEWKKVKLGELYEVHNGLSKGSKFFGSGYPFLSFSTIFNNWFIPERLIDLVQSTEKEQNTFSVKTGDVFITRTSETADELGMSCVALKDYPTATYNGFCKRLRQIQSEYELDNRYIGYFLRTPLFRSNFLSLSGAMTTRASLKNDDLLAMEINLPPLPTQQKIAAVLGAYDDLIENNRKQIKLLEEAAQKLYKEWFVELHFPGWENTKIVDGIPEGWKKGHIVDIGEFKRGKTITKDQTIPGSVPVVAGGLEPAYYHNVANTESPVITVSGSGANAGFTRLYNEKVWASDCSFLDASKCENLFFIYCCLKTATATIDNLQKGAAQPHVYAKDINALEMLIPNDEVLSNFDLIVKNYFIKIKDCQVTIRKSQATRDELLPKLMSGEIDVSDIKLPTVEE